MTLKTPDHLLLDALVLPPVQGEEAWRRWRASTDLNHLDNASFHMLPVLAGRIDPWLQGDPQAAILAGICRRAWSQNQLRLKILADALGILRAAGIERVAAIGPVLWGASYWPAGAIRPINAVDVLTEPVMIRPAVEALLKADWTAPNGPPVYQGTQFYFAAPALMRSPSGGDLRVHWRGLPNTDFSIRRPPPPLLQPVPGSLLAPFEIPVEHSLVAALGGNHQDSMDWRYDALMICRQPGIHWETVRTLLRWRSRARERLDELRRDWGAHVAPEVTRATWTSGIEHLLTVSLQRYRAQRRKRTAMRQHADP